MCTAGLPPVSEAAGQAAMQARCLQQALDLVPLVIARDSAGLSALAEHLAALVGKVEGVISAQTSRPSCPPRSPRSMSTLRTSTGAAYMELQVRWKLRPGSPGAHFSKRGGVDPLQHLDLPPSTCTETRSSCHP